MAKALHVRGIDFDCYEKGSRIGGNWCYMNDNGMSSAYKSLHINTSREMMAYADFPMPDDYPDYPHHSQIMDYFEDYVDHFGFRDKIKFNTAVAQVELNADGLYSVRLENGETHRYKHMLVANGHHWSPRLPETPFPGSFNGETLHSHDYKVPDPYAGKRVCVLGIGNSGVDIACELARLGGKTMIATRSGAYIMPKYLFGKPTDTISKPPLAFMPLAFQRATLGLSLWLTRGKQESYGVPTPKRPLLREHPTVSADLLNMAGHGKVQIKPNIKELAGDEIVFEDGSREAVDVLIYATGYQVRFPFFADDFVQAQGNKLGLYHFVVHPEHPHLYFIGLIQPLGAIMPLAEQQSEWIASIIAGTHRLPSQEAMRAAIAKDHAAMRKRYIQRDRHTLQVDFFPYKKRIQQELKRAKG